MKPVILKSKRNTSVNTLLAILIFSFGIFMPQRLTAQKSDAAVLNTVKLGDVEYSLGIVSIAKNKDGYVTVKVDGSASGKTYKFWQTSAGGKVYNVMPSVGVEIISNGKTVSANGISIEEDGMLVEFPTKILPVSIIFFSVNNDEQKVVFDAKSKKPASK